MMALRPTSARAKPRLAHRLTLAAGLVSALLVSLLVGVSLHYRVTLLHAAQNRTTRLSFLLAEQVARTFESVDFTLRGFEPLLDGTHPFAAEDLTLFLQRRVSELSFVQNMRVIGRDGRVIATSSKDQSGDIWRRGGCAAALSQADAPPLIIGCDPGDVGINGQPSIAVARRVGGTDGHTAQVIVADVDPGYFSHFFHDLDLGSRAIVTLTEDHGHVLLASAEKEKEKDDEPAPALIPPTEQARLGQLQRASRDNIASVHGTDGYPLSVLVAIDRGEIERQWRQAMAPALILTLAVSGLLFLFARTVERHRAEREAARQRAMVAQKLEAMGQMTASVAHDFRNILTVMAATLRLLRRGAGDAVLAEADNTIQRGNALVDRLLAFSRRADPVPELHDVNDLLRKLEGTLRHIAGPEMRLSLDLRETLPLCRIDRIQFEAALMNLVNNASQAMKPGGSVMVRSDLTGSDDPGERAPSVVVAVSDTGCGIDEPTLKRIFEPFFTTKSEHGTGLGLAQVQACVEQVGGAVTVDSTVGVGTTVFLHLPGTRARSRDPAPAAVLTLDPV